MVLAAPLRRMRGKQPRDQPRVSGAAKQGVPGPGTGNHRREADADAPVVRDAGLEPSWTDAPNARCDVGVDVVPGTGDVDAAPDATDMDVDAEPGTGDVDAGTEEVEAVPDERSNAGLRNGRLNAGLRRSDNSQREAHDPDPEAGPELIPELVHHGPQRRPTTREIEEHNITHTPAKAWCSTCVASKATADPHRRRRPEEVDDAAQHEIAKVYFDYGFFRNRVGSGQVPFLVATCKRTAMKKAFVTQDRTGGMPATVRLVEQCLRELGHHGPVVLRSDWGKPAARPSHESGHREACSDPCGKRCTRGRPVQWQS